MPRHHFFSLLGIVLVSCSHAAPTPQPDVAAPEPRRPNPVFEFWDKDKDGYLTGKDMDLRRIEPPLAEVDTDGDGRISRSEHDAVIEGYQRERADQALSKVLPAGASVRRDIVFTSIGSRELKLDLYQPADVPAPQPTIVWFHGGGWTAGSKNFPGPAAKLVGRGYAVASAEYRLAGEATFPAAVHDAKAAVSFLRLHAADFGLDPERFRAFGISSGAYLAVFVGTTGDLPEFEAHAVCRRASSRVQAVCDWFGPTDFTQLGEDYYGPNSPESMFLGGPVPEHLELARRANPIAYITPADPPMLIVHGELDKIVPLQQSKLLYRALQAAGVESTLVEVPGAGHGFRNADGGAAARIELVAEFFDRHLRP